MAMSMRRCEEGVVRFVAPGLSFGAKHLFDTRRHGDDSGEFGTLT